MTGQLRTTLHDRAECLETWDADLSSIVRDGDRRLRRRRQAVVGGAAALALAVGLGSLAYAGRSTTVEPGPADPGGRPLVYAVGSVIHSGDDTVDVGERVVSLVQTHWGYVFSTPDLRLHQVRNGTVEPITTFDGHPSRLASPTTPLVTSDDGLLTAWFDGARIQTWPGYRDGGTMVDDLHKTNSFNAAKTWSADSPPRIQAVSDGHLYFWDGRKSWIAEVRPMTSTAGWPDHGFVESGTVQDAAGDRILVRTGTGLGVAEPNLRPTAVQQQDGWHPGTDLSGVDTQAPDVASGDISPDGKHWFTDNADQFTVFDSATGRRQEPSYEGLGFRFAAPYQWLGDDTIAVLALRDAQSTQAQISLLTCRVSSNDCTVAADDIGGIGNVALPDGRELGS